MRLSSSHFTENFLMKSFAVWFHDVCAIFYNFLFEHVLSEGSASLMNKIVSVTFNVSDETSSLKASWFLTIVSVREPQGSGFASEPGNVTT